MAQGMPAIIGIAPIASFCAAWALNRVWQTHAILWTRSQIKQIKSDAAILNDVLRATESDAPSEGLFARFNILQITFSIKASFFSWDFSGILLTHPISKFFKSHESLAVVGGKFGGDAAEIALLLRSKEAY